MNTGIIIQARMSSTRLSGKAMKKLGDREILWHVVNRCQQSKLANHVIVATSTDKSDNVIYNFCKNNNIDVYRGDLNDVLGRYYQAAKKFNLDTIVRVTGDCPLIDPDIIDASLKLFSNSKTDYVSNCLNRIFPHGLDCEVFSFDALRESFNKAAGEDEREHATLYMVKNKSLLPYDVDREYVGDFRLTIDEENDYKLLKIIYKKFYNKKDIIDTKEVIKFLKENPDIWKINISIEQKKSIG